jgi:hypothetical protein
MLGGDQHDAEPTQQTQPNGIDLKTGKPYEPVTIPVPKRSVFDRLLRRAEKRSPEGDSGPYTALDPVFEQKVRTLDRAFRESRRPITEESQPRGQTTA